MEDHIAYHIATKNRFAVDQIISFKNNEPNQLCNFFFGKTFKNSNVKDLLEILNNNYEESGIVLDEENSLVALKYMNINIRATRELITEYVRLMEFKEKPSRLSCLYCARSYSELIEWKKIFESYNRKILQIVKVEYSGNYFIGDGDKLPKENCISFFDKMEEARCYWKGNENSVLPEMLVNGDIRIVEIVEEFE